jgi:hypothetical protein
MGDWKLVANGSAEDAEAAPAAAKGKGKQKAKGKRGAKAMLQPITEAEPKLELYDLAKDPSEKIDLAKEQPEQVAKMKSRLLEMLTGAAKPGHLGHQ